MLASMDFKFVEAKRVPALSYPCVRHRCHPLSSSFSYFLTWVRFYPVTASFLILAKVITQNPTWDPGHTDTDTCPQDPPTVNRKSLD